MLILLYVCVLLVLALIVSYLPCLVLCCSASFPFYCRFALLGVALLALTALLALLGSLALFGLLILRVLLRLRRLLCLLALLAAFGSRICLYLAFDRTFVVSVFASTLQSPPTVVYGVHWDSCVKCDGTYQSAKNLSFWLLPQTWTCMVARFVYVDCCWIWFCLSI